MAIEDGALRQPCVLEPMMTVEVVTPEENMGDVLVILTVVVAWSRVWMTVRRVNLSRRSSACGNVWIRYRPSWFTQGRATYTMEFSKYAEAPSSVAEAVIKKNS